MINVEKSRYVKEKSKIPITVSWEGGVKSYSGLLDCALAGGYVLSLPMAGMLLLINLLVKLDLKFGTMELLKVLLGSDLC